MVNELKLLRSWEELDASLFSTRCSLDAFIRDNPELQRNEALLSLFRSAVAFQYLSLKLLREIIDSLE